MDDATRAMMSTKEINDLPDSAFAYIEPGGEKDDEGKTVPRSLRHFPIHDAAHVRNALARMSQSPHGEHAKEKIMAAAKKLGVTVSDDEDDTSRSNDCCRSTGVHLYAREFPLEGIEILRSGDGRTVEAYAAIWDTPAEIRDQHGHYMETIHRSAFDSTLAEGIGRVGVFYHHGMTLHGTPSDLGSVPIGSPVDIRVDGKGLRTITRYNDSDLADAVLSAIRNGDIRGYSFRGPIRRSEPRRIPKARAGQPLPTVTRTELGLTEYGPTPSPAYVGAGILAVRSRDTATRILTALDQVRSEVTRMLSAAPPLDQATDTAPPASGPGAEDQPTGPSGRHQKFRQLQEELRALGVL